MNVLILIIDTAMAVAIGRLHWLCFCGSKLGPLLFILYTSDVINAVSHCRLLLYADDSCLYSSGPSFQSVTAHLQSDIDNLSIWFNKNLLQLNGLKTELVLFKKFCDKQPRSEIFVKVNSHPLFTVTHARYLGVQFDENINWKYHLDYTVKKVSRKGVLRRYGRYLTDDARAAYFRCLVQPDLEYCSSTWSDGSQCINSDWRALKSVHFEPLHSFQFEKEQETSKKSTKSFMLLPTRSDTSSP